MNRYMKKMKSLIGSLLVGLIFSGQSYAETPSQDPLFLVSPVKPIMMFNMSKDHQLFFKLYDDYSNIDNLPDIETTYKNTIDYYGYFDSQKCYIYNVADGRFTPNTTPAVDHYCQATTDTTRYWSGNFLNWATMTRMDAIRKILYGGYRSTDTNTLTVLERAFLPNDAHSFAKWYGGSDLRRLTPYDPNLTGVPEEQGLTLCNTSEVNDRATYSQNATGANDRPVIRLARGNYSLWASNERWQCRWGVNGNGNVPGLSRINAYANSPVSTTLDTRATINISGQVRIGANSNEVNWESGDNFNGLGDGGKITIDGTEYTIDDATSSTQLDIDTTIDPPLTGVVTITSASNQVDLVTGDFTGLAVNDVITIDGSNRQITAVNSASQLTVNYTYPLQTGNVVVTGGSNQVTYSSGTNFVNITTGSSITIGGQVRSVTAKASNNQITVDSPVTATTPVTGRVRITPSSSQINYVSGTNFANLVVGNTITIDGVARTVNTKTDNNRINVNTTYANIVGTVSHTSGSNLITYVSGTNFSSLRVGDSITFGSGGSAQTRTIASIPTSTTMTVNTNMTTTTTRGYTVGTRDRDYSANIGVPSTVAYSAAVSRNVNFSATRSTRVAGYTASYITTTNSENTELIARVEVNCNASTSSYKCGTYKPTTGTYSGQTINKPIGLLQEYANKVNFGLMTGSYRKSKSGGVLRKMVGPIDVKDELNDTNADEIGDDGIFKVPSNSGNSIIQTLNVLRLYGYSFNNGVYNDSRGSGGDNCDWALSSFVDELVGLGTGRCSNWGNPQAEIFLESLRYLAGKKVPATDFATNDSTFITGLNQVSAWDDPITSGDSGNKCAALNILQFNASTTSYDNDNLAVTDLSFTAEAIKAATTYIGSKEQIGSTSTQYFIGRNSSLLTAPAEDRDQLCTPKNINATTGGLGAVDGLCSEAPRLEGGYNIAGLAYLARKNGIGSDREKVKTHGVVLSPAIPSIDIKTPNGEKTIRLLPACRNLLRNSTHTEDSNCSIVDFKVVEGPDLNADGNMEGRLYVNWEDSEQGGDYDQDLWGVIEFEVSNERVYINTQVMAQSTGDPMGFGYVISGTKDDGFHVHSGANEFVLPDSGCAVACSCRTTAESNQGACSIAAKTEKEFEVGESTAEPLKNPLWYAAKWGGYTQSSLTDDEISSLDPAVAKVNAEGVVENIATYFYATEPRKLEAALAKLFEDIAGSVGSASTVAANSTSSQGETHVYQARFDSEDWSGQILDFELTDTGVSNTSAWDTHNTMSRAGGFLSTRNVYTYDGATPAVVKLTNTNVELADPTVVDNAVPDLTRSLKLASEADYSFAVRRIKWLRGDVTDEKIDNGSLLFRPRTHLLGDIINSDPGYAGGGSQRHQNLPSASAFGAAKYLEYVAHKKTRRKMVFVGANDGMLHAFDAADGKEVFAYIPRGVFKKLSTLMDINYSHQYTVDGPVYVSDYFNQAENEWRTMVVGTLGSGGRGAYGLDVTDVLDNTANTNTPPTVIFDISDDDSTTDEPNATLKNDIGYSGSKVLVLPVNAPAADGGGRWMAIFSNGTDSLSGQAKLIAIDVNDPTKFVSVDTGGGAANGLSPAAFLLGGQNVVVAAYAGDINGNMWKIDISNSNYLSWASAFGSGTPLINVVDSSGTPQPITAEPTLGLNSLKLIGGTTSSVMVYFATGKYSNTSDLTDTSLQSIYAVADADSPISINASNRTDKLHEKWIDTEASGRRTVLNDKQTPDTATPPGVSPAVDWLNKDGWFMDMVLKSGTQRGERGLNKPLLISDRLIVNTFIPSNNQCDYGGAGWLMELVGVGDKYKDHTVLGDEANTQLSRPIISDLVPFQAGDEVIILGSNLGGKKEENLELNSTITSLEGKVAGGVRGRMSWRQIK